MPSPWMTCLKKRAVPVPALAVSYDHPLGLVLGLRPDPAVDMEPRMPPGKKAFCPFGAEKFLADNMN